METHLQQLKIKIWNLDWEGFFPPSYFLLPVADWDKSIFLFMSIEELILFHSKRIHHIQNSLQTINLFDLYPNLKELINMFLPSKLDFKI